MFNKACLFKSIPLRFFSLQEKKISYLPGTPELQKDSKEVQLRGIRLKGNSEDLPHLIFFTDLFDTPESWMPFFLNDKHKLLDYRNVFILNPRNFGMSDRCNDVDDYGIAIAGDLERFMYNHKITMATVGGHGLGAKNALLAGTYKSHLITGVLAFDYAPQDYKYFEIAHSYNAIVKGLKDISLDGVSKSSINEQIDQLVQNPKLNRLIKACVKQIGRLSFQWTFNLPFLINHFEQLTEWQTGHGLFTGRSRFLFPEYSNHVFLSSNTIAMRKTCISNHGYGEDIFALRGNSDNPEHNHWIYENAELADEFAKYSADFLANYDGVHTLLKNRSEIINKTAIPSIGNERVDKFFGEYAPSHYHHNWRFNENKNKDL